MADGQLSASSSTLIGVGTAERVVTLTMFNTSLSAKQEIFLTVTRSGSSARVVAHAILEGQESLIVKGLPLDPSDVLAGYASSATTVDYIISQGSGPFAIETRDKTGAPKVSQSITVTLPERGIGQGDTEIIARLDDIKELLMKIA